MNTVLIVDDEPAIREIFSAYLGIGGYMVLEADGGPACLDLLATHTPDVILLDMMMEPMDGWETLLAIRNNPSTEHIPVIIITGKQPVPEEILKYGGLIEDFIVKPVDFKEIMVAIPDILENDRELARESERLANKGRDPKLLYEYVCLLRLARVAHNLSARVGDRSLSDRILLQVPEERMHWLHKKLGFSDHVLESGGVKVQG
jgi:two-component system, OmpR family, response regulator